MARKMFALTTLSSSNSKNSLIGGNGKYCKRDHTPELKYTSRLSEPGWLTKSGSRVCFRGVDTEIVKRWCVSWRVVAVGSQSYRK